MVFDSQCGVADDPESELLQIILNELIHGEPGVQLTTTK